MLSSIINSILLLGDGRTATERDTCLKAEVKFERGISLLLVQYSGQYAMPAFQTCKRDISRIWQCILFFYDITAFFKSEKYIMSFIPGIMNIQTMHKNSSGDKGKARSENLMIH